MLHIANVCLGPLCRQEHQAELESTLIQLFVPLLLPLAVIFLLLDSRRRKNFRPARTKHFALKVLHGRREGRLGWGLEEVFGRVTSDERSVAV